MYFKNPFQYCSLNFDAETLLRLVTAERVQFLGPAKSAFLPPVSGRLDLDNQWKLNDKVVKIDE